MTTPQFTIQAETSTPSYSKFVIEPLPQGFGHTLGNSLRRVLYSSIPGAAVTSVTIVGASHQFTTIDGVKEDIVQIVLNLKQIRCSYSGDKPEKITLSVKGPAEVTAGQFETPPQIKIANPDLVIAHLADKNAKLDIEAIVEAGYGYSPAEDRKSTVIGQIPVDAAFTPTVRVNYSVESTRVGRLTNFDKLILEIHTDGTVSPQAALTISAQTLVNYLSAVVHPQTSSSAPPNSSSTSHISPGNNVSIEELDLPTRISNALVKAGFETITDLVAVPKNELAKVKNLGSKSVKIIEQALQERGFELV